MDATTFPISFSYHLIFCIAAGAFFLFQFFRLRRPYQLILGVGIPCSLLIYINSTSQTLFHAVGLFECILLIGAIVLSVIHRIQIKRKKMAESDKADAVPETNENAADYK